MIYSLSIHRQNHKVHGTLEDATQLTRLVLVRMLATIQTIVLRYTVKKRGRHMGERREKKTLSQKETLLLIQERSEAVEEPRRR